MSLPPRPKGEWIYRKADQPPPHTCEPPIHDTRDTNIGDKWQCACSIVWEVTDMGDPGPLYVRLWWTKLGSPDMDGVLR